jgi:hypothetical protein
MDTPTASGAGGRPEHLERTRLGNLRDEVGDRGLGGFVKAFLILLDERLDRIGAADPGSTSDALRAERDLRISSAMLGAGRLVELLLAMDAPLRTGLPAPRTELAALQAEAEATAAALSLVLDETDRL